MEDLFGTNIFETGIGYLDFKIIKDSDKSPVILVEGFQESKNNLSPYQIFSLEKAKQFGITAVYFRYFENLPPQPQIYIIDKSLGDFSESYYAKIHRNIWSSCEVPISIVLTKTEIRIYDCRKPVKVGDQVITIRPEHKIPLNRLKEYGEVLKNYNALKFDNGSFWDSPEASKKYLYNKSAYSILTAKLKAIRDNYKKNSGISDNLSDRLLITCILIKYLEENGEDDEGINQAVIFLQKKTGCNSLLEVIRAKKLGLLLDELAEHFNGGIFKFNIDEKKAVEESNFSLLLNFLDDSIDYKNQIFLWKQFSFKYIPVELISNFYEEFLPREDVEQSGAVYTPSYLVELLVDQCLPLSNRAEDLNENIKLIDVSCGSGIFLVMAYKRLVQRYILSQRLKGNHNEIVSSSLIRILKNIHGIDENEKAVNLTLFSLSLAVCSFLSPRKIWTELKFENLITTQNIESNDFFEWINKSKFNTYDLVIGNPPFKDLKEDVEKAILARLTLKEIEISFVNPHKQLALLFLEVAMKLLKANKLLCLIIPSGPLLYFDKSLPYRKGFFSNYNVPQIFDFTYLRRILFQATVPVVSIFVEKANPTVDDISHIVFKRTKSVYEKQHFEMDHYDTFNISKELNLLDTHIWKYNLLGGNYVRGIVERLQSSYKGQTIKDFLISKRSANWRFGPAKHASVQANTFLFANRITHGVFPIVRTKNEINSETYFVSAPNNEKGDFQNFKNSLLQNGPLYSFYMSATSGRQGLRGPYTIVPSDFQGLPYLNRRIPLSKTERIVIDDIIDYRIPEFGSGEDSEINKTITLKSRNGRANKIFIEFGETFSEMLNFFYEKRRKKYSLQNIYEGESFFICEFNFTTNPSHPQIHTTDADIKALLENKAGRNLFINRNIRLYNDYQIILVKPKQLRYWLRSIALRDADETLADIYFTEKKSDVR